MQFAVFDQNERVVEPPTKTVFGKWPLPEADPCWKGDATESESQLEQESFVFTNENVAWPISNRDDNGESELVRSPMISSYSTTCQETHDEITTTCMGSSLTSPSLRNLRYDTGGMTQPKFQMPENEPKLDNTRADSDYTTIMLCGLPCSVMQAELVAELEAMGFGDYYDFLYVPTRYESGLGYGFINFLTHSDAVAFQNAFRNYRFSGSQSKKSCIVKPARLQGLGANMDQFAGKKKNSGKARNKPCMAIIRLKEGRF